MTDTANPATDVRSRMKTAVRDHWEEETCGTRWGLNLLIAARKPER